MKSVTSRNALLTLVISLITVDVGTRAESAAIDLRTWDTTPSTNDAKTFNATFSGEIATLKGSSGWSFIQSGGEFTSVAVEATVTIEQPAKEFNFFGQSWSVWPGHEFADRGFEAAISLGRKVIDGRQHELRVQLSHKYQCVALVDVPNGGFVRVAPCEVAIGQPVKVAVERVGSRVLVKVNDQPKIDMRGLEAQRGQIALGSGSGASLKIVGVNVQSITPAASTGDAERPHEVKLSVRSWLGGRPWVFDGDEPIVLLPSVESSYINNVKLRPGDRPRLSWNSHWDIQNQGAFREGTNNTVDVQTSGGGRTVTATWRGKHAQDRFATRSTLVIGYDLVRHVYTYDTDSELEVGKEPFEFRYGYDFEHHTPLDPFGWQYLLLRRDDASMTYRPVSPFDPGPTNDVQQYHGLRVWHGRHPGAVAAPVSPAVEYEVGLEMNADPLDPAKSKKRQLNTAVCAAFYDTGVSFAPEKAPPGTKVHVKYRYTGYPAEEAAALFAKARLQEQPTIDPDHHFIFADQWPKLTFSQFVPMSEAWIIGRTPFMTGHNRRPSYQLAKVPGKGDGYAMQLGPGAYGTALLPKAQPLAKGRYTLRATVRSDNTIGPGGRLELKVLDPKEEKALAEHVHYVGNGTFAWKPTGFSFDVPLDSARLRLGMGNAGTGDFFVNEVEFQSLAGNEPLPTGVLAAANSTPSLASNIFDGTLADYRLREGRGLYVFDEASGPIGMLELGNVTWTTDEGRPALRFADPISDRPNYPRMGPLDLSYLRHPSYADKQSVPVALAGHHGGGFELPAFTIAAWIKPADQMGASSHPGFGDILGVGARRLVLRLQGQQAPYKLAAALNVNDRFVSDATLPAERWSHVALTGQPSANKQWQVTLYLNGQPVGGGETKQLSAPLNIPPSIVLGTEIFYFHNAYYRGLIGRCAVLSRALSSAEIQRLMSE